MSCIVHGMKKPECCLECPFLISRQIAQSNGCFQNIYGCTHKPQTVEDGWHDFYWTMHNVQPWCPIEEVTE